MLAQPGFRAGQVFGEVGHRLIGLGAFGRERLPRERGRHGHARMPAARAARTPMGASSKATQSGGPRR